MHPSLEPLLAETYGVMIYQEQVMQIAQTLSGYSLGEADSARAMGKKIKAEMAAQKARFIDGAVANNVDKKKAGQIFDQVDKFAGYGFNKSHAAGYALIAYQTAYLKANYPVAFFAASMSLDFERVDKLAAFKQDAADRDIAVLSPDINKSDVQFAIDGNSIFYALSAIRNVGTQAMHEIVTTRKESGAFRDVFDFARRAGGLGLNRKLLENLIAAGALDCLEPDRARLSAGVDMLLGEANIAQNEKTQQENLFGEAEMAESAVLPSADPWSAMDRLAHEFDAIGFYLSGHPLDDYQNAMKRARIVAFADLEKRVENELMIAGVVTRIDERRSQRGTPFAFVSLSDVTGQAEVTVFSKRFPRPASFWMSAS